MPNWCSGRATITGPEPVISEIKQILKNPEGDLLNWMVPQPNFAGDQDWYMWRVNNWGTKWSLSDIILTTMTKQTRLNSHLALPGLLR